MAPKDRRGHRRTSSQVWREGTKKINAKQADLAALREKTQNQRKAVQALEEEVETLKRRKALLTRRSTSSSASSSSSRASKGQKNVLRSQVLLVISVHDRCFRTRCQRREAHWSLHRPEENIFFLLQLLVVLGDVHYVG